MKSSKRGPVASGAADVLAAGQLVAMDVIRASASAVRAVFLQGESWLLDGKRASYGLAVTRILLGVMILGTLLSNFATRLYTFGAGSIWTGQQLFSSNQFVDLFPFSIVYDSVRNDGLFTVLYMVLIACAVAFTVGYRTRLFMIPMFILWVGLVEVNEYVSDQSDNLTRIAMIAIFFAAPAKRWSLDARRGARFRGRSGSTLLRMWRYQRVLPTWMTNLSQNLAIVVLACQISFIYVSGGLYKAGGAPWSGGTAIYDPIHVQQFGTWPELSALVTTWGPGVAFATTLTLLVQVSFPLLLMRRGTRIFALVVMLGFHVGIAVLMGLPWFSLAMIALDAIFIRDKTWRAAARGLCSAWKSARADGSSSARAQVDGGAGTAVSAPASVPDSVLLSAEVDAADRLPVDPASPVSIDDADGDDDSSVDLRGERPTVVPAKVARRR